MHLTLKVTCTASAESMRLQSPQGCIKRKYFCTHTGCISNIAPKVMQLKATSVLWNCLQLSPEKQDSIRFADDRVVSAVLKPLCSDHSAVASAHEDHEVRVRVYVCTPLTLTQQMEGLEALRLELMAIRVCLDCPALSCSIKVALQRAFVSGHLRAY